MAMERQQCQKSCGVGVCAGALQPLLTDLLSARRASIRGLVHLAGSGAAATGVRFGRSAYFLPLLAASCSCAEFSAARFRLSTICCASGSALAFWKSRSSLAWAFSDKPEKSRLGSSIFFIRLSGCSDCTIFKDIVVERV
jgi:hypothetical protein